MGGLYVSQDSTRKCIDGKGHYSISHIVSQKQRTRRLAFGGRFQPKHEAAPSSVARGEILGLGASIAMGETQQASRPASFHAKDDMRAAPFIS